MSATIRQEDGIPQNFTGRVDYTTRNGRESHYYMLDGEKVGGVTTILKDGMPRPEGLKRWDRTEIAAAAVDQHRLWKHMDRDGAIKHLTSQSDATLNEAANRGTTIHDFAEHFAVTGEFRPDVPEHLAARADAFVEFVTMWRPTYLLVEKVVFSVLHLYAGTFDAVAELPGLGNTLLDYKTAKAAYPENALQLAAYRYASFWIDDDTGERIALPRIDSCAVVTLGEDGHRLYPIEANRAEFGVFLKAKALADFGRAGRRLVGRPLAAPKDEGAA